MEYGSIFETGSNAAFARAGSGFLRADWQLFRSGRDAMKALARAAGRKRVLLPALCCESMLVPFAQSGYELVFYRLREDLRGDETDVLNKLRDGDMFLYLSYFGVKPFSDAFLESLRAGGKNLLLAEDRTQDLIVPRPENGFQPDAMVASLRKWAALPEGGVRLYSVEQKWPYKSLWDCPNFLSQKFPAERFTVRAKLSFRPNPQLKEKGEQAGFAVTKKRLLFCCFYYTPVLGTCKSRPRDLLLGNTLYKHFSGEEEPALAGGAAELNDAPLSFAAQ